MVLTLKAIIGELSQVLFNNVATHKLTLLAKG
jgi:hypothetical protein